MKTGRYSLSELLDNDNIEHIIIPEMQRDYVWRPENVERLLASVKANFTDRRNLSLEIREEGLDIPPEWSMHLSKEFQRLKFNTRIGFIYAYYDSSDGASLYLIDGQQRITTLFLTLIALYAGLGYKVEFKNRYFKDKQPKLDYKVRESAHRFLVDFIDFMLEQPTGSFATDSPDYYGIYAHDPTVKSILANYEVVRQWVESFSEKELLLDYVENFIEFNYFDTGLSRQGERLYLYMNSRGEQLSLQEKIRPTIIYRAKDKKLDAGRQWELWQHFFWKNRGDNPNADKGFMGFLKLAVILHQQVFKANIKLKPKEEKQSFTEVREDYIRHNKEGQEQWILQYIIDNGSFDYQWMGKMYRALLRVSQLCDNPVGPCSFIRHTSWRAASSIEAVNYIPLCGALLMAIRFPDISDKNLYRLGMYLLNRSDVSNNSKTTATPIRAMELVESLDNDDIRINYPLNIPEGMNYFDSIIWRNIHIADWEELFWEMTENKKVDEFFDGNHDAFIKLACPDDNYEISTVNSFFCKFSSRFFNCLYNDEALKEMLDYGDLSIEFDNSTINLGKWMSVRRLPAADADWLMVLQDKKEIIHNFIVEAPKPEVNPELRALSYAIKEMNYRKFLYRNETGAVFPNYIIANAYQIKPNLVRDLPVQILKEKLKDSWCWNGNYHYCVLELPINDKRFAFEFEFHWSINEPKWTIYLKSRQECGFADEEINALTDFAEPIENDPTKLLFRMVFTDTRGYLPDGTLDSINNIVAWVGKMKPILTERLGNSYQLFED